MKITELRITPIAVGDPPLLNAAGMHAPYALRIILEMETDAGITGLSEIPGGEKIRGAFTQVRELLIGRDPFQLNTIRQLLVAQFGQDNSDQRGVAPWDQRRLVHVFSALEVAALDIMGKQLNRPLVDLLGGRMRDEVPFAAYLFFKHEGAGAEYGFDTDDSATDWMAARQQPALNPLQIVEQAKSMCEHFGFRSIKLKGGALEPQQECDSMLALREAFGPDVPLRFDPNAIWSYDTALHYGQKMKEALEYYEDPVRGQKEMSRLRRNLDLPLATNMCTTSFADLPGSIQRHSEDIILSDHHFWGGLRASMDLYRICQTFGRGFSMHSNSHLGISLAAMVHLGAALPEFDYALDTHYPWQVDEVIQGGKLSIRNGNVRVPDGPGLGVELDREALQRLHENYLNCGLEERDDETEMKKVSPDWQFQLTRW